MQQFKYILFVLQFCFITNVLAQDVLRYPEKYNKPVCLKGNCNAIINTKSRGEKNSYWTIFADRQNVQTYESPSTNSLKKNKLEFKKAYYVVAEEDDWVHIYKGSRTLKSRGDAKLTENSVDYGWVQKKEVLLWKYPIIDENTKISIKAILLNTTKSFVKLKQSGGINQSESAPLYANPAQSKNSYDSRSLYDFYYVLKRENDFLLLSTNYKINDTNSENYIVGWVDIENCTEWKTRVAIEPNFSSEAFSDRKSNQKVIGFKNFDSAVKYSNTGVINDPYWQSDPVILDSRQLYDDKCEASGTRYQGSIVRFPFLSNMESSNIGYIQSGVIATYPPDAVDEDRTPRTDALLKQLESRRSKLNVFYLIEGNAVPIETMNLVLESVDNIKNNLPSYVRDIRFGAGVFYEEASDQNKPNINLGSLSPDKTKLVNFLQSMEFSDSDDDFAVLYKALEHTIQSVSFKENENNLLVVIGRNGDISSHPVLSRKYPNLSSSSEKVASLIVDKKINVIGIQTKNLPSNSSRRFASELRGSLVQAAQESFNKVNTKIGNSKIPNPIYDDTDEMMESLLRGGLLVSGIKRPKSNSRLTDVGAIKFVTNLVNNSAERNNTLYNEYYKVFIAGKSLSDVEDKMNPAAGSWPPGFAEILLEVCQDIYGNNCDGMEASLEGVRYKIFDELYFPSRFESSNFDPFSYVVFMSREELRKYRDVLTEISQSYDSTPDQQRDALYAGFSIMLKTYSGGDFTKSDFEKSSAAEILEKSLGLSKEMGARFFPSYMISDITNKNKMSNIMIEDEIKRLKKLTPKISEILTKADSYCFSYTPPGSEFLYFWIPLNLLF